MSFKLRSSLAQQAEKFLYEDSQSSSESDFELEKSLSPLKTYSKRSKRSNRHVYTSPHSRAETRDANYHANQSTISHRTAGKILQSPKERLNFSKSKSVGRKSERKKSLADINEQLSNPVSCRQEKYLLRTKIEELEQIIGKQNLQLTKLYDKVSGKREEVRDLTEQLMESRKESILVLNLKEKIQELEDNEIGLIEELQSQKRTALDAQEKLQELQNIWENETQRAKYEYQENCIQRLEEEQILWESKMKRLEKENWKLSARVRELENGEEIQRTRQEIAVNNDLGALKEQLKEKEFETARLRNDVQELKQMLEDVERVSKLEVKSLKRSLETLEQQNRNLRANEEDILSKESREKQKLKKRLKQLQEDLEHKEKLIRERDLEDKEHLEKMNKKVSGLQTELKKLRDYEEKIERLERALAHKEEELELTKKYYNKKLEESLESTEEQKREWNDLYNELAKEIRLLKGEIDHIDGDNKVLMSSLGLKDRRVY